MCLLIQPECKENVERCLLSLDKLQFSGSNYLFNGMLYLSFNSVLVNLIYHVGGGEKKVKKDAPEVLALSAQRMCASSELLLVVSS